MTGRNKLRLEKPVILDPCKQEDCALVAFQVDGRPVVNPTYANEPIAVKRVEDSKILLNLDHPDFNTKREQLYHDISNDVRMHEELGGGSASKTVIRDRLEQRLLLNAPFSIAAKHYLRLHRHLAWVESLVQKHA